MPDQVMNVPTSIRTRKDAWALIARLYRESLHRHVLWLVFPVLAIVVGSIMASAYTYMMGPFVDKVLIARDSSTLWVIGGAVIGIFVIRSSAQYLQEVLMVRMGQKVVADAQKRLFSKVIRHDLALFDAINSGSLVGRLTYDVNLLRITICDIFLNVGKDTMTVVTMVSLMFFESWQMALISLAAVPLAIFPFSYLSRRLRQTTLKIQATIGDLTADLIQAFKGIQLIRAYGLEASERKRVTTKANALAKQITETVTLEAGIMPVFDVLAGMALAIIIVYGGHQVIAHQITPGKFLAFSGSVYGAYQPLRSLSRVNVSLQTGLAAAQRIFELYDRSVEISPANDAVALPRTSGAIEFHDVSFTYPDMDRPALDGLSLIAPAGLVTALVGRAGVGKSTVLNLIERFYDPNEGSVSVNGQDIRSTNLQTLRDSIALVSQNVTLFDDTIAANIGYGRLGATGDEILAAAEAAGVLDFATRLPQGINTHLVAGGLTLSGGQRQCISIARAILRNAPILLLDEATAAQDAVSEHHIQKALHRLMHGRTTIVIAHRLGTIKHADMIHVLDAGKVVESGRHDDLINKDALYATLHKLQFQDHKQARSSWNA